MRAVPVGLYAKAALEKLGIWAAVEPKLAMTENVRAGSRSGRAPGGPARHRLRDRRQGRAERQDHRRVPRETRTPPIIYPAALTTNAKPGAARISRVPAHPGGEDDFRKIRVYRADQAGVVMKVV